MVRSIPARILTLLALLTVLAAQSSSPLPFGAWHRVSDSPVIAPRGNGWESAGTFNPAVVIRGDKIVMLYRAQDKQGTSRLGYAESADGIHFNRRDEPVLSPAEEYEKDGGVEDPRLVQFGDTYYLTYTGYNKKDAQLCLATSKDLIHWDRKGHHRSSLQRELECEVDEVGRHRAREDRRKILDVLPGNHCRQQGSGRLVVVQRSAPLERGNTGSRITREARAFRFARRRAWSRTNRYTERNRPDLQRRRRETGLPHRDRDLRPQRSPETALAKR